MDMNDEAASPVKAGLEQNAVESQAAPLPPRGHGKPLSFVGPRLLGGVSTASTLALRGPVSWTRNGN